MRSCKTHFLTLDHWAAQTSLVLARMRLVLLDLRWDGERIRDWEMFPCGVRSTSPTIHINRSFLRVAQTPCVCFSRNWRYWPGRSERTLHIPSKSVLQALHSSFCHLICWKDLSWHRRVWRVEPSVGENYPLSPSNLASNFEALGATRKNCQPASPPREICHDGQDKTECIQSIRLADNKMGQWSPNAYNFPWIWVIGILPPKVFVCTWLHNVNKTTSHVRHCFIMCLSITTNRQKTNGIDVSAFDLLHQC